MKKVTSWLLVFIAVNAILAISGFFWLNANLKPASEDQIEVELVIPKGKSATQIAFALKEKGLIGAEGQMVMFFTARKFWVELLVKPNIDKGVNVLGDRGYPSTGAYQGYAEGGDQKKIIRNIRMGSKLKPPVTPTQASTGPSAPATPPITIL